VKPLFALDRLIGRVESVLLVTSLAALLLLTLYSVAYRNLLAPVVLKMQARAAQSSTGGVSERDRVAPVAVPDEVGGGTRESGDSAKPAGPPPTGEDFAGDLEDDEEAAPAAAPAAGTGQAAAKGQGGEFAGDLEDDEEAAPAAAPAAGTGQAAAKKQGGDFAGDLEDDEGTAPAAAPAAAPTAAPTPDSGARVQDHDTLAVPPPAQPESLLLRVLKFLNFGWIDTVTRHLLLWIAFFGGAIATRHRRHIKIDALSRLLPEEGRNRLTILLDVAAIAVCVVMARAAWKFMTSESETDAVFYGSLPVWVGIAIIPVGFGLLIWHFLLDCLLEVLWSLGVRSPELVQWREELHASQGEVA